MRLRQAGIRLLQACLIALLMWRSAGAADEEIPRPLARPGGLDIHTAIAITLERNPRLFNARAGIEEARGWAMQASLYPNPRLDSGNPQTIGGGQGVYTTGFSQEVLRGGKMRFDRAAADRRVQQLQLDYLTERFNLFTTVRKQFYSLLAVQERYQILQTLLKIAEQSEKSSQQLLDAGRVSDTDVLLLRVERRRAEGALQNAEITLRGLKRQMAAQMGDPNLYIDHIIGDLSVALPDFDEAVVMSDVLSRNAQLESARVDVARSQLLLRRAEAERIQNLTVQGGYQYNVGTTVSQGLAAVYFNIPLFNRNQGNIRAASANLVQSVAQVNVVGNDLQRQVADALARYQVATRLVHNFDQGILPDARRTLTLVQQGYGQGQLDLSRLLQTQRSVFEANLDYISHQESRLTAASEVAGLLQIEQFP